MAEVADEAPFGVVNLAADGCISYDLEVLRQSVGIIALNRIASVAIDESL